MGWFSETFGRGTLDQHGQPLNRLYRAHAVEARQIDELIGLVKGVLADGAICQGEVEFLLGWMNANRNALNQWPAKVLYPRIATALQDGYMDEREEQEIMELLLAAVGGNVAPFNGDASDSTTLPFSDPLPQVAASGRTFCFTGKFNSGTRDWCCTQVIDRGGFATNSITKKVNFLVIGEVGSRDWLHSTYGTKIQKAIDYRDQGTSLHIIGEQYWYEQVIGA